MAKAFNRHHIIIDADINVLGLDAGDGGANDDCGLCLIYVNRELTFVVAGETALTNFFGRGRELIEVLVGLVLFLFGHSQTIPQTGGLSKQVANFFVIGYYTDIHPRFITHFPMNIKQSTLTTATGLALGTALISGVSNFVAKISVTVVKDPIVFTTLKNVIVAVFLMGLVLAIRKWRELKTLSKKQWLMLIIIGIVGGSVPFALYFTGLKQTSAINAALIHKSMFIWIFLLAAPILKERMTKWQWLGIGLVVAANVVIGGFKGFKFNAGELMILGATLLWAVENIIAKIALKGISSTTVAASRMVLGSIVLIDFLALRSQTPAAVHLTAVQWQWTLLSSALLIGYVLTWYAALKRAPATYVAVLLVPATMVTNILSAVFITHKFPQDQFLNALLLTVGAFLLIRFAKSSAQLATTSSAEQSAVRSS